MREIGLVILERAVKDTDDGELAKTVQQNTS